MPPAAPPARTRIAATTPAARRALADRATSAPTNEFPCEIPAAPPVAPARRRVAIPRSPRQRQLLVSSARRYATPRPAQSSAALLRPAPVAARYPLVSA